VQIGQCRSLPAKSRSGHCARLTTIGLWEELTTESGLGEGAGTGAGAGPGGRAAFVASTLWPYLLNFVASTGPQSNQPRRQPGGQPVNFRCQLLPQNFYDTAKGGQ